MVYLSRIYTKTGDSGETALGDGSRVSKDDLRVAAYGSVDELNATLGLLLVHAPDQTEAPLVRAVQNDLFDLGADLCVPPAADETPGSRLRVRPEQVTRLEAAVDRLNAPLAPLTSFVLPGGTVAAAWCHLGRTVCRRSERDVVSLSRSQTVNPQVIMYLNRLSDLLFVLARVYNSGGGGDVLWRPGQGQDAARLSSRMHAMFTISAFADEISPDPQEQIDVLSRCAVNHIELRSILKTNVLDLSEVQIQELRGLLLKHGFRLSAIGSPIGKVRIDAPFEPHLDRFRRAVELCKVFDTPNIRVFSYYPPGDAETWDDVESKWEQEVFDRMKRKAEVAEKSGVRMLHENEHRIYGDSPDRVARLFATVQSPALAGVYDAANYVFCGYDPLDGWAKSRANTVHFHIKDWKTGEKHGSLAGQGDGQWPIVLAEAVAAGYQGFATLEPHLLGGGPTGGVTGPELFPQAIEAFRALLKAAGG